MSEKLQEWEAAVDIIIRMHGYNAKDLARSFRTVRNNTIQIAEEIPEDQYGFRPAPDTRTVAETLAHLATSTAWPHHFHGQGLTNIDFGLFMGFHQKAVEEAARLTTKAQLVDALRKKGEDFASWLETVSDAALAERIQYPAGMQPPDKTRFEMLMGAKEHEMHHRAQLMTIERMIGITPHLTRAMQERMAQMQGTGASR
jgi:uncharacterized damage-inducible protein DinB